MQDVQTQTAQANANEQSRLDGEPEGAITPRILLDEMVMQPRRAAFISFVSVTTPKNSVNKTYVDDNGNRDRTTYNQFWDRERGLLIEKVSTVQAIINANYGNSVDNALERAGIDPDETDFEVSEHSWANPVDGAPLVQHKYSERYYLAVHVQRRMAESVYRWKETGEPLSDAELDELFTKYYNTSQSKKQSDAGLDESEQVVYRNYKASSIREIKMGGHHWMIESGA